jgi:Flp pilus assembly protein TadD
LQGKAFFSLGKNREALSSLQKAVQVDPAMPDPEYLISQIYIKGGDLEAAQRHIELFKIKKLRKGSP